MSRRVFISYQHNDLDAAKDFSELKWNEHVGFEFHDRNMFNPVNSENPSYVRSKIKEQMNGTSVTVVIIGSRTASSEWVNYEIDESIKRGNGVLGIILPGEENVDIPSSFKRANARIIRWEPDTFSDEVEISALIAGRPPQSPPRPRASKIIGRCGRGSTIAG